MDKLAAQTVFFKAITEMTTDKVYKYIPDSDTCIAYHIEDGTLVPVREIQCARSVFFEKTEESSHKTLTEMFEMICNRIEKASFGLYAL